jgi:DNA-binding transcriptional ArsR family regulator
VTEDELEQALMRLYELGLVSIEYDDNLEARFKVTDVGRLETLIQILKEGENDV